MTGAEVIRHIAELAIELGPRKAGESSRDWALRVIPQFSQRYQGPQHTLSRAISAFADISSFAE